MEGNRCPNCGAALVLSADRLKKICNYCDSEFPAKTIIEGWKMTAPPHLEEVPFAWEDVVTQTKGVADGKVEFIVLTPSQIIENTVFMQYLSDSGSSFHLEVACVYGDKFRNYGIDNLSMDTVLQMVKNYIYDHKVPDTSGWELICEG